MVAAARLERIWGGANVRLCNCASCGKTLLGLKNRELKIHVATEIRRMFEEVYHRRPEASMGGHRRPFCRRCFETEPVHG